VSGKSTQLAGAANCDYTVGGYALGLYDNSHCGVFPCGVEYLEVNQRGKGRTMAIRKHSLIEINDLLSIRLSCDDCRASLSIPISDKARTPLNCPNCGMEWFKSVDGMDEQQLVNTVIQRFVKLKAGTTKAVKIQIEIEQPDSPHA